MQQYSLEPANYSDYRDFLTARFKYLKSINPKFSLLSCAKKGGLSKSHLQFLLQKKRHLNLDKFPGLAKSMRLTSDEEYFVYLLICKNSSQNAQVILHFEKILSRLRHQSVVTSEKAPNVTNNSPEFLNGNYLAMILHSLCRLQGFQEDPSWIKKALQIESLTQELIISTLVKLEKEGALVRDDVGRLRPREFPFWRPDPLDPRGLDMYRKGAEGIVDLLKTPGVYKPSVYMLMSLALDEAHLAMAEKLMIDVHHQLASMASSSKSPTANIFVGNFLLTLARLKNMSEEEPVI